MHAVKALEMRLPCCIFLVSALEGCMVCGLDMKVNHLMFDHDLTL